MKNKKGFTTVELIAVLVILALVTLFAFPSIRKIYYNNKNKEYFVYENMMVEYAKSVKIDTGKSCVYLNELNIDKLDPAKGCTNGYVKTDGSEYKAFLQCNQYTTGTPTPDNNNYSSNEKSNCYDIVCNRFEIDDALKIDESTKSFDKCCHIYDGKEDCDLEFPSITVKDEENFYTEGWQTESGFVKPKNVIKIEKDSEYKVYHNVIKEKLDSECPTIGDTTVNYDGKPHSISVSGGTGGIIRYSTNNKSWGSLISISDAGSQKVYVKVEGDTKHKSVTCGYKTIKINKVDAVCPTTGNYTGNYDGSAHFVSTSGGSGGTVQYSSDNTNWGTNNPTRIAAGNQTTYVRVVGDKNHNSVSCPSRTITINKIPAVLNCSNKNYTGSNQIACSCSGGDVGETYKATNAGTYTASCTGDSNHTNPANKSWTMNKVNATCPGISGYSGNYDGVAHTIAASGGSGGTVQYSTNGSNWSTTKPTMTSAGGLTVYVRVEGDSNHNTVSCGNTSIVINKIPATLSCSNKTYTGSNQVACSCSGGYVDGTYQATNAGTYTASCTGDTNHTNPANKSWTMGKVAATLSCSDKTYNGANQVACSCSGGDVGGTYQATNAGTYTASCTGDSNHTNPEKKSWTMGKAAATLTCSDKTYNGSNQVGCSCSGGTVGGTYEATNQGTYTASCTGNANHTSPSDKSWKISRTFTANFYDSGGVYIGKETCTTTASSCSITTKSSTTGWATSANSTTKSYNSSADLSLSSDKNLYKVLNVTNKTFTLTVEGYSNSCTSTCDGAGKNCSSCNVQTPNYNQVTRNTEKCGSTKIVGYIYSGTGGNGACGGSYSINQDTSLSPGFTTKVATATIDDDCSSEGCKLYMFTNSSGTKAMCQESDGKAPNRQKITKSGKAVTVLGGCTNSKLHVKVASYNCDSGYNPKVEAWINNSHITYSSNPTWDSSSGYGSYGC